MTITLYGGVLVASLDPVRVVEADVQIDGDRISRVESSLSRNGAVIDCSGCLVIPGNVNAHMHLYSALARGLPYRLDPPANFVEILQRIWWRLDRALDEESVRASALVGGMEALLAGTTAIVDHHASPNAIDGSLDLIANALEEVGVRSVLCYEVSDRDGLERATAGVEENRRFAATARGRALTRGMVGGHASFTLSEQTLAACVDAARGAETGIHIHVGEDLADQTDCEARFGVPVVQRLADAGVLDGDPLLAHCVFLSPDELLLLRERRPTIAHNARSNMNNAVGRALIQVLGELVCLGTDGIGSDMFAESQAGFWREREENTLATPGETLGRLARSARFVGRAFHEPALGGIEPGAPADLAVVDYAAPAPITETSWGGHWMFGMSSSRVRDVVVAGEPVVRDRRLITVDQEEVAAKASVVGASLWERMDGIGPHRFEPKGG